jgi:hypothetical protein
MNNYEGIMLYTVRDKNSTYTCVYVNALTTNPTIQTSGMYALVTGPNFCFNNLPCNEITLIDNSLPVTTYGYHLLSNGIYEKFNWYVYDDGTQSLYFLIDQIAVEFYGPIDKEGFSPISECKLDSNGNCIPAKLGLYRLYGQDFIIIPLKSLSLLPFARDTLTNPECPCSISEIVIPTCNEICSSANDPDGNPLKCDNGNDDPLQMPCKCYYEGPVNIIIKPMQKYNPFRMMGNLVSSLFTSGNGDSTFLSSITDAIKTFLTPVWNTIKLIASTLSSILGMVVEAITTYANPVYIFNLFKNLISLGAEELGKQIDQFVSGTIVPALKALWDLRLPIMKGLTDISGYIWENLKVALKALSDGFNVFAVNLISYTKVAIVWTWNNFVSTLSTVVHTVTPFVPATPTAKVNVVLLIGLLLILGYFQITTLLSYVFKWFKSAYKLFFDILLRFIELVLSLFFTISKETKQLIIDGPPKHDIPIPE